MAERVSTKEIAEALIGSSGSDAPNISDLRRQLQPLADKVELDMLDVSEAAIDVAPDGGFAGEATAYVLLRNAGVSDIGEEVPVRFRGSVDEQGKPRFEALEADLSPFSE